MSWKKQKPYSNWNPDPLELEADEILHAAAKRAGVTQRDWGIHEHHRQRTVTKREISLHMLLAQQAERWGDAE